MVVQRITSCSFFFLNVYNFFKKKKKKMRNLISKKKKKKTFSSSHELCLDLILYENGTWIAFQRPGPNHPNNLGEQSQNNVTKLFGVHVRLSPFVLYQACLNLGYWPIYIECGYVLIAQKHVFI